MERESVPMRKLRGIQEEEEEGSRGEEDESSAEEREDTGSEDDAVSLQAEGSVLLPRGPWFPRDALPYTPSSMGLAADIDSEERGTAPIQ